MHALNDMIRSDLRSTMIHEGLSPWPLL